MKKKLAIITTHPIQYNAPLFRLLNERENIAIKVFYTWGQSKEEVFDARFGMKRSWDIPLLDGYDHEFVLNTSHNPDSNRFFGIMNPDLIQKIKSFQPDSVLVYRWSVYSHLKFMLLIGKSIKLFFRGDSYLKNKNKGVLAIAKTQILKLVYRKVDKVFYVGRYNKEYYLKYGLKESQLIFAPHAVDNDRFSSNASEWEMKAAEERTNLFIPNDAIVFLYAGKFYELKQLDVLIKAFKKVKGVHYRLVLYGNGEQEHELKDLAKEDTRILFQSFKNQSEMCWVYRVGDVFLLTSKSETWGLGVNEAMACARPAIVSNQCGCSPELIVENKTGFTFHIENSNDLVNSMQKFTSREMAKQMGKEAFNHIKQFSLERVAKAIEQEVTA
jgi:glycosyltransferase involved in cell wall biosynthesis